MFKPLRRSVCSGMLLVSAVPAAFGQPHRSFVADANREFAAIFSHPKTACSSRQTTSGYSDCISRQVAFTELHLANLITAIRGIAAQDDAQAVQDAPSSAHFNESAALKGADLGWKQYRKNLCDLRSAGMAGGSGEGNAAAECVFEMDRAYAEQLADAVYLHTLAE